MGKKMTLRDQFAAAVLPAVYSDREEMDYWCQEYSCDEAWLLASQRAYEIADAMLIARQGQLPKTPNVEVSGRPPRGIEKE